MAMEFANNGGAQTLASVASLPVPAATASFAFWVNMTSLVANIRRFMGSATNFEIRAGNAAGTTPPGIVVNDLFNDSDGAMAATALVTGQWFHVVGTGELTGGNSITDVYINGVLNGGPTTVVGSATAAGTFTIGNRTGMASSEGLNGILDDVRVYNRRLSAAEVRTIHAARGVDGIVDGLIARVLFGEGPRGSSPSGAGFVKDVSNNKINYTPTGSPVYRESILRFRRKLMQAGVM